MLWFAAGTWLFLAAVLALRVLYEPGRFAREARSPAALTGVLGTAFAVHGYYPVAAVMLGLAGVSWALLLTTLAARNGAAWLLIAASAALILGLTFYVVTVTRFALGWLTWMRGFFDVAALVLWCLAMLWPGPLIAAEALRPRLSYDVQRWATVFPLGMYAACSFAVGQVTGITRIVVSARVWT